MVSIISKLSMANDIETSKVFSISKDELIKIVDEYEARTSDEDINFAAKLGGIEEIVNSLKTSVAEGIEESEQEISKRIDAFGSNKLDEKEVPSLIDFAVEALEDFMLRILLVCAVVQISIGVSPLSSHPGSDWIDGVSIIFAVVAVVVISSYTNYSKEKKFQDLNEQNQNMMKVTIKRNGRTFEISPDNLVVGDLVKLKLGGVIPADGILIESTGLQVDESSLTGESDLIEKFKYKECLKKQMQFRSAGIRMEKHSIPSFVLISGTSIKNGEGWMIVIVVGPNSVKGKIKQNVEDNEEVSKTPLEEKLDELAEDIGKFGLLMGILTAIVLIIRLIIFVTSSSFVGLDGDNSKASPVLIIIKGVLSAVMIGIAIIVVAIPEGLPLAVTLSLAFSVKKMMNDNNLVRKMKACETMGCANVICTDKTGTLTKNEMELVEVFDGEKSINLEWLKKQKSCFIQSSTIFDENYFSFLTHNLSLNIDAEVDSNDFYINESKTDKAFIEFLHKFGVNIYPSKSKFNEKKLIHFNSQRKKMTILIKHYDLPKGARVIMKGASEVVLSSASSFYNPSTRSILPITDEIKTQYESIISHYAEQCLRTICLAYKDISVDEYDSVDESQANLSEECQIENKNFTMLGLFGIKDSLRDNVAESIITCKNAGINVIMVTGDNKETARAIAIESNILSNEISNHHSESSDYTVLCGKEFFELVEGLECSVCTLKMDLCKCPRNKAEADKLEVNEEKIRNLKVKNMIKFEEIADKLKVLARSRPIDKFTLVLGLKDLGLVVAVTGDGTNDAQALSKSDVGFAMGIQGTDIAKDAADIIILDDNFSSIVRSVVWGRSIYDNIRKFIQFQLSINLSACLLVLISSAIGNESPITIIQMLWLNLIMDTLGSLALATESPSDDLLNRQPSPREEYIINSKMWKHIIAQASVCLVITLLLYIQAPFFIEETEYYRILESERIYTCYGQYPGRSPNNGIVYIISGNHLDWPSSQILEKGVTTELCGGYMLFNNMSTALIHYRAMFGNTPHMTIVFNVFVLYSTLNQINSRIIDDSYNVFRRITTNYMFIMVVCLELILQVIIIEFGGSVFNTSLNGLTAYQWSLCIGLSLVTFLVSIIVKIISCDYIVSSVSSTFNDKKNDMSTYSMLNDEKNLN